MKNTSRYTIYLFPILIWMITYFGFSFDGLYGQDAYEYLRYTEALKTFLETGKSPGDYFWGVYYPVFGSILNFIIPNTGMALQLISVLSLVVTSIYIDKIIRLIYSENTLKNIPFLFFTLSPIVLIHSLLVMSDILTCCFITISIYCFLKFLETSKNSSFLFGIGFGVLAVFTRYASVLILLPFCFSVFVHIIRNKKYTLFLFLIIITAFIVTPHILIRSQNSLEFLSHQWLLHWDTTNLFRRNFTTIDGEMNYNYINLIYIFFSLIHPVFIVFGIVLLVYFIKNSSFSLYRYQKLFLASILIYAVFLGGIPFQNKRFLLLSFPLIIVWLFPLMQKLFLILKPEKLTYIFIFLIQILLGIYFGRPYYERNLLEKNIVQEMKPYQGQTLYVFDVDIAMKRRKLDFNYISLWKTKHSDFEENALVLINEKQLEKQWKGKNPLLNWNLIKNNYSLEKLKHFSGDFNLYHIEGKK